jgi:hypothetical protein
MGLIADLASEEQLRALYTKYDGDTRAGYGYVGDQPYIRRGLMNPNVRGPEIWGIESFVDDGIVRGGITTAGDRTAADVKRIFSYITKDLPQGVLFGAKQVGLQLMNPKVENPAVVGNVGVPNLGFLQRQTRIYDPTSLLGSTAGSGFGIHGIRHGLPFLVEESYYEKIATANNQADEGKNNRLVTLYTNYVKDYTVPGNESNDKKSLLSKITGFVKNNVLGINDNNFKELSGPAGPNSILGAGFTAIDRVDNTRVKALSFKTDAPVFNLDDNFFRIGSGQFFTDVDSSPIQVVYNNSFGSYFKDEFGNNVLETPQVVKTITDQQAISDTNRFPTNPQGKQISTLTYDNITRITDRLFDNGIFPGTNTFRDFRKIIINQPGYDPANQDGGGLMTEDYQTYNMVSRIGVGLQDNSFRDRSDYRVTDELAYDKINALGLFKTDALNEQAIKDTRDLVKFRFEALDSKSTKESSVYIVFRAIIKDFNDNYTANWDPIKYVGRADKFYVYNGFERQIRFGFTVAATSRVEMKPIFQKLNYLASNLTPEYVGNKMRGPLMRLTLGDYLLYTPGFLTSLSYTIDDQSPWEIAIKDPEGNENGVYELPHVINVDCGFTPIHEFLPQKSTHKSPFILPRKANDTYKWLDPTTESEYGQSLGDIDTKDFVKDNLTSNRIQRASV